MENGSQAQSTPRVPRKILYSGKRLPANIGPAKAINYNRVVMAYTRNLTLWVDVPQVDVPGVGHVAPMLLRNLWERTHKSLQKHVAVICQAKARERLERSVGRLDCWTYPQETH